MARMLTFYRTQIELLWHWRLGRIALLRRAIVADEILDVLLTVAANVGASRVMSAAPKLAMALGYDVEEGLEALTDEEQR